MNECVLHVQRTEWWWCCGWGSIFLWTPFRRCLVLPRWLSSPTTWYDHVSIVSVWKVAHCYVCQYFLSLSSNPCFLKTTRSFLFFLFILLFHVLSPFFVLLINCFHMPPSISLLFSSSSSEFVCIVWCCHIPCPSSLQRALPALDNPLSFRLRGILQLLQASLQFSMKVSSFD